MFELTINDKVYKFNFGFGFRRELDPKVTRKIDNVNGKVEQLGVQMAIAGVMDGDIEDILNVLDAANKGFAERVTRRELEEYIESTDIDVLTEKILDFLKSANATKKIATRLQEVAEEERAKAAAKKDQM